MKCAETGAWLDRLMDGELSDDERRELEAHAQSCATCADEIRAALQMKALFDDMPAEADVPLEVQARWRGAVRAEARQRKSKKLYRWIGSAAAAIVAVAGIGWALNANDIALRGAQVKAVPMAESVAYEAAGADAVTAGKVADDIAPMQRADAGSAREEAVADNAVPMVGAVLEEAEEAMDFAASEAAVIETDGAVESKAAAAQGAPMREIHITVADVEAASAVICDLVAEYDGDSDAKLAKDSANLYVAMPSENVPDFIKAIAHLDVSGAIDAPAIPGAGTASLLLVLESE